jgi:hypothetical protein
MRMMTSYHPETNVHHQEVPSPSEGLATHAVSRIGLGPPPALGPSWAAGRSKDSGISESAYSTLSSSASTSLLPTSSSSSSCLLMSSSTSAVLVVEGKLLITLAWFSGISPHFSKVLGAVQQDSESHATPSAFLETCSSGAVWQTDPCLLRRAAKPSSPASPGQHPRAAFCLCCWSEDRQTWCHCPCTGRLPQ